jgi:hypothetical protein
MGQQSFGKRSPAHRASTAALGRVIAVFSSRACFALQVRNYERRDWEIAAGISEQVVLPLIALRKILSQTDQYCLWIYWLKYKMPNDLDCHVKSLDKTRTRWITPEKTNLNPLSEK